MYVDVRIVMWWVLLGRYLVNRKFRRFRKGGVIFRLVGCEDVIMWVLDIVNVGVGD